MTIIDTEDISPPATPPTHSPIPHRLSIESCSLLSSCHPKDHLAHLINSFQHFTPTQKQLFLYEIINHCDNTQLTFLNSLIAPRLKVDFLKELPPEIAHHILSYIDSPATLSHAARISKYWNMLIKDEALWKILCKRYRYITNEEDKEGFSFRSHFKRTYSIHRAWRQGGKITTVDGGFSHGLVTSLQFDEKYTVVGCDNHRIEVFDTNSGKKIKTLEGHEGGVWALQFKGGEEQDPERVLLSGGCDRDVRVWDLNQGKLKYILRGHTSTVRCLKIRDKQLAVTGSRDTTLRVWDLNQGKLKYILRGHTSTVRCLKIRDKQLAVTGSRDTTLRVWDIQRGTLLHTLVGHQASVRCVDIHQDIAVSGSYDFTARVWDLKTGRCKHVLIGHTLQIYTIVTNGTIIATGAMDAHIRIWSAETGECLATLHGHTSLVGQLQLSGTTLVSGGADGCLRVWDMETFECKQQFSAHDNSITCLQFDDQHILSAANDGKVKLWDIKRGRLIRNFTQPSKIVWKIQFNQTKAVVLMQRKRTDDESQGRTVMEIHDFDLL